MKQRFKFVAVAGLLLLFCLGLGAWQTQQNFGTGGVIGPGVSTSTDIPTFNGTSGGVLQDPGGATLSSSVLQMASGLVLRWSTDTGCSRDSAGVIDCGNGTAADKSGTINAATVNLTGTNTLSGVTNVTGTLQASGNKATLTADWTCGTGGTVSSCTSATIIGSGGGVPLTFTLPLVAASYKMECDLVVGQATGDTANNWNLLTATNGATNVTAFFDMYTAAAVKASGVTADQAATTTTFNIGGTWTLGGLATKMPVHIVAQIEGASASGTVVSLQLVAPTVGDLVTIYRGSGCRIS